MYQPNKIECDIKDKYGNEYPVEVEFDYTPEERDYAQYGYSITTHESIDIIDVVGESGKSVLWILNDEQKKDIIEQIKYQKDMCDLQLSTDFIEEKIRERVY